MDEIRVAVIGCGSIAKGYHLEPFSSIPQATLVAAVDLMLERAEECAKRFDIPEVYTDYREVMSRDDIDAVMILTRFPAHHELVLAAADAGKHIFMQKPFAANMAEAEAMAEAVRKAGVKFVTSFMHRYFPESVTAKEYIAAGALGKLKLIRQCHPGVDLMDIGPHGIDLVRHFAGQPIVKVSAMMDVYLAEDATQPYCGLLPTEVELRSGKISALHYEFADGTIATHDIGVSQAGISRFSTEIYGEEGVIFLRQPMAKSRLAISSRRLDLSRGKWIYPELESEKTGGVLHHKLFIDDILNGTGNSATLEDGIATLKVVFAAHQSARKGVAVEVEA